MNAITLIQVLAISYFLAINVYGFILINFQRKNQTEKSKEISLLNTSEQTDEEEKDFQENISQTNNDNKTSRQAVQVKKISDFKLFTTGILGGALGIYVAMFVYKYRLSNFFLMVFIPVFIALNVYLITSGFLNGFWINF